MENSKDMELAAIWLNRPVTFGDGTRTARLAEHAIVRVVNDEIVDCGEPTHVVVHLMGGISSGFAILIESISDNEVTELKL